MAGMDSMKILKAVALVSALCLLLSTAAFARDCPRPAPVNCIPVCEGKKPVAEYLEDALALALDVPLALLSPITIHVLSPLVKKLGRYDDPQCPPGPVGRRR